LKKEKLPGNDRILAELISAGSKVLWSELNKLIASICNREKLPD
jgi:hypothetical protein